MTYIVADRASDERPRVRRRVSGGMLLEGPDMLYIHSRRECIDCARACPNAGAAIFGRAIRRSSGRIHARTPSRSRTAGRCPRPDAREVEE